MALTDALDRAIKGAYASIPPSLKSSVCLVALGGYGRRELCFGSDTDIMFLLPDDQSGAPAGVVQRLLHQLLDLGLDVGHSARTVNDCLGLHDTDIESWVSLTESRFLCGNRTLFRTFRTRLQEQVDTINQASLMQELLNRLSVRQQKYGNSTKLLEPNIKNSSGGLRDLHTVLWLFLATGMLRLGMRVPRSGTAVTALLASPPVRRRFPAPQLQQVRKAFDRLLRTRNEMHLKSKGLHDSLEFVFQRSIADGLGYTGTSTRSSVERFMQDYYVASRHIGQFTRGAVRIVQQRFAPLSRTSQAVRLDDQFSIQSGRLFLRAGTARISTRLILTASLHAVRHQIPFSDQLADLISRRSSGLSVLRSKEETLLFRELLNCREPVGSVLQELSERGVLERWIPEWKGMVAFFQHNQYHYYTADEHTLRVIQHAEDLESKQSTFGDVYRSLPRKDTFVLACLLHDIAKPRRVRDHEVTGTEMARSILARLRCSDLAEDVAFLVRHHLMMEQVAFRRNLGDPQTIIDFASRFRRPVLLEYLYVLTFADLSAVNKNVWTDWKGMLLYELYRKAKEILEGQLTSEQVHRAERTRHSRAVKELVDTLSDAIPRDSSLTHLEAVDSPEYLSAFDAREIADHIRHIERNKPVATMVRHLSNFTEITVIARDAPSVLSKFCGVLSANDANIFDAHVFTTSDGVVIDKFRVIDFVSRTTLNEEQTRKIHKELNDVLSGSVDVEHLLARHRMKWRRLARVQNPNTRSAVEFEDHPRYTIIDIFAPDRLGFLYKITEAIASLRLNISFAKIATRADGIVDSFYVSDEAGNRIDSPEKRNEIREALLRAVTTLLESELVSNP